MEAAQATTSSAPVAQTETGAPNAQPFTPSTEATEIKVSDWTSSLNEELKGYAQTKGFKDPQTVLDSYRGLEKLMGAPKDRLLKLPEKADAPEWNDIYAKLGRPNDPKEYKFEGVEGVDPKIEGWARENFHKLGLSQKQGESLLKSYRELETVESTAQAQSKQVALKNQEDMLKKEWGSAFDQNIQVAKKAAAQFGFDGKAIDSLENAMGYDGVMKFLQNIGSKIGESSFVGPNSPQGFGNVMTPAQAKYEISELKNDKGFIQRWASGDREAKLRFEQLHKWASPE